jgi:hypothetical protein
MNRTTRNLDGTIRNRCQRCNEPLNPGREVWLELDQRTNRFVNPQITKVPVEVSQGGFPFGKACAAAELKRGD